MRRSFDYEKEVCSFRMNQLFEIQGDVFVLNFESKCSRNIRLYIRKDAVVYDEQHAIYAIVLNRLDEKFWIIFEDTCVADECPEQHQRGQQSCLKERVVWISLNN